MSRDILTPEAAKAIERNFDLTDEAWKLLALIAMEFKSDPTSTQCFDGRIVQRTIKAVEEHDQLKKRFSLIQ